MRDVVEVRRPGDHGLAVFRSVARFTHTHTYSNRLGVIDDTDLQGLLLPNSLIHRSGVSRRFRSVKLSQGSLQALLLDHRPAACRIH